MKYIRLKTTDPYYNLAVEEFLFRHGGEDCFMLWQNRPSVIVGKNQNVYTEVNTDYAADKGISVVRRITGGGAVYHDLGNVNYTFISSSGGGDGPDFARFARPVIHAISLLGVECSLSGRNDIECKDSGRKISGNAQFSSDSRTLHHGTLLFDANVGEMSAVLKADRQKLEQKAIRSHRGRVANLKELIPSPITVEEFIAHVERTVLGITGATASPPPTDPEIDLLAARNASAEWIYSNRRYLTEYTVSEGRRFPFGRVSVRLSLKGNTVERAVVSGDFFEIAPVSELERLMEGRQLSELRSIDPSRFIDGMTSADLWSLVSGE